MGWSGTALSDDLGADLSRRRDYILGNAGEANTSVGRGKGKGASPESLKIVRQVRERIERKLKGRHLIRQETAGQGEEG